MSLTQHQIYYVYEQARQYLSHLGHWQLLGLALYSVGLIRARHSAAQRVAEGLSEWGSMGTIKRRLERFLSNGRLEMGACCQGWTRWVLSHWGETPVILLVDETKLGQHLSVMVVGVAWNGCCIPLAWRCYQAAGRKGQQVTTIATLLDCRRESIKCFV